jgi:hypothetical protein
VILVIEEAFGDKHRKKKKKMELSNWIIILFLVFYFFKRPKHERIKFFVKNACGNMAKSTEDKRGQTSHLILKASFTQVDLSWIPNYPPSITHSGATTIDITTGDHSLSRPLLTYVEFSNPSTDHRRRWALRRCCFLTLPGMLFQKEHDPQVTLKKADKVQTFIDV